MMSRNPRGDEETAGERTSRSGRVDNDHLEHPRSAEREHNGVTGDGQAGSSDGQAGSSDGQVESSDGQSAGDQPGEKSEKWGLPLLAVIIGTFLSVLSTSSVNVALPAIQKDFNIITADVQWISTAYLLGLGVTLPASAWLGDRLGMRRAYVLSLLLFTVITGLCGTAGSLGSLIFYRVLQALVGGVLPALALTTVFRIVPAEKLAQATSLYGMGVVVGPGLGPSLGGVLVQYVSWRMVFFVVVPLGLIGVVLAQTLLPPLPGRSDRRLDLAGLLCIAGALFALLLGLDKGQTWGWTTYTVLMLLAAGVNLLVLFVAIEMKAADPLLDLSVFRSWPFVNSLVLIAVLALVLYSIVFYVPLYLQEGQMLTPPFISVILIPQALALMVMMPIAGRLYGRFGPRWPAVIGLSLMAVGLFLLTGITINMTRPEVITWFVIVSLGIGLCLIPILTGGISALPSENSDVGSTVNTVIQRVAAGFGLSLLTALATEQQAQFMADRSLLLGPIAADTDPLVLRMASQGPSGLTTLHTLLQREVQAQAYSNVFLVAGSLAALGAVLALFLRSGPVTSGDNRAEDSG